MDARKLALSLLVAGLSVAGTVATLTAQQGADSRLGPAAAARPGARSTAIAVVGEIAQPGVYEFGTSAADLQTLVSQAGGLSSQAGENVKLLRQGQPGENIRLTQGGTRALQHGDILVIESRTDGPNAAAVFAPRAHAAEARKAHAVLANVLDRPVVVPLSHQLSTLPTLIEALKQTGSQGRVMLITPGDKTGTPLVTTFHDRKPVPVPDGSVVIFEMRSVNPAVLPPLPAVIPVGDSGVVAAAEAAGARSAGNAPVSGVDPRRPAGVPVGATAGVAAPRQGEGRAPLPGAIPVGGVYETDPRATAHGTPSAFDASTGATHSASVNSPATARSSTPGASPTGAPTNRVPAKLTSYGSGPTFGAPAGGPGPNDAVSTPLDNNPNAGPIGRRDGAPNGFPTDSRGALIIGPPAGSPTGAGMTGAPAHGQSPNGALARSGAAPNTARTGQPTSSEVPAAMRPKVTMNPFLGGPAADHSGARSAPTGPGTPSPASTTSGATPSGAATGTAASPLGPRPIVRTWNVSNSNGQPAGQAIVSPTPVDGTGSGPTPIERISPSRSGSPDLAITPTPATSTFPTPVVPNAGTLNSGSLNAGTPRASLPTPVGDVDPRSRPTLSPLGQSDSPVTPVDDLLATIPPSGSAGIVHSIGSEPVEAKSSAKGTNNGKASASVAHVPGTEKGTVLRAAPPPDGVAWGVMAAGAGVFVFVLTFLRFTQPRMPKPASSQIPHGAGMPSNGIAGVTILQPQSSFGTPAHADSRTGAASAPATAQNWGSSSVPAPHFAATFAGAQQAGQSGTVGHGTPGHGSRSQPVPGNVGLYQTPHGYTSNIPPVMIGQATELPRPVTSRGDAITPTQPYGSPAPAFAPGAPVAAPHFLQSPHSAPPAPVASAETFAHASQYAPIAHSDAAPRPAQPVAVAPRPMSSGHAPGYRGSEQPTGHALPNSAVPKPHAFQAFTSAHPGATTPSAATAAGNGSSVTALPASPPLAATRTPATTNSTASARPGPVGARPVGTSPGPVSGATPANASAPHLANAPHTSAAVSAPSAPPSSTGRTLEALLQNHVQVRTEVVALPQGQQIHGQPATAPEYRVDGAHELHEPHMPVPDSRYGTQRATIPVHAGLADSGQTSGTRSRSSRLSEQAERLAARIRRQVPDEAHDSQTTPSGSMGHPSGSPASGSASGRVSQRGARSESAIDRAFVTVQKE